MENVEDEILKTFMGEGLPFGVAGPSDQTNSSQNRISIAEARSFMELLQAVNQLEGDGLSSSDGIFYSKVELLRMIGLVQSTGLNLKLFTRELGLRDKVEQLLKNRKPVVK